MVCGVYIIKNKSNGKLYVGKSISIKRRWYQHKYELKDNIHFNDHLQNSWNKYTEENFSFEVLEECKPEELNDLEKYYIKKYDSMNPEYGYNLESGGSAQKQVRKETRTKHSEATKGDNNPMYGKHHTDGAIEKISEGNSRATTSTGFYRVSKQINKKYKQGFIWRYVYPDENKKRKPITSICLWKLMLKVISKGLPWEILDVEKARDTIKENGG